MIRKIRPRLTYANVMSSIAVFVVLGGGAYAATALPNNSVGTKQIKKNAVTAAKIKGNAVTGAKVKNGSLTGADLKVSTLPKVPSAANADNAGHASNADNATKAANADNATNAGHAGAADTATTANGLAAPEAFHEIGAPGEPGFLSGAFNYPSGSPAVSLQTAGFMKDHDGFVHLKGIVQSGTDSVVFALPAGYRPADKKLVAFTSYCNNCSTTDSNSDTLDQPSVLVAIIGAGINLPGAPDGSLIISGPPGTEASLDGLTFRAGA
jgi:hypothetical protein